MFGTRFGSGRLRTRSMPAGVAMGFRHFPAETAVPEIVSERQSGLPDESLHNDDDGGDSGGEPGFVQTAGECDLSLKSHLERRLSGQSLEGSIQICVQG